MNAVIIDVSKGKSMVAIIGLSVKCSTPLKSNTQPVTMKITCRTHQLSVEGESRIVMEHTGRYYEVLAHQLSGLTFSSYH